MEKIRIRDKHPGSATLINSVLFINGTYLGTFSHQLFFLLRQVSELTSVGHSPNGGGMALPPPRRKSFSKLRRRLSQTFRFWPRIRVSKISSPFFIINFYLFRCDTIPCTYLTSVVMSKFHIQGVQIQVPESYLQVQPYRLHLVTVQ
jgi:hypothetical protein